MRKTKEFNNFSNVKPPKLKAGERAIFELINLKKDRNGKTKYPAAKRISPQDRIVDGDDYTDIACVRDSRGTLVDIWFYGSQLGKVILNGNRALDNEIYAYLMLSNYREGKENRDPSIRPLYRLVDDEKNAKTSSEKRRKRSEALNIAYDMTNPEVKEFASAMGWNTKQAISVLRDKVEDIAENKPFEFIEKSSNKDNKYKAIFYEAEKAGLIQYDGKAKKMKYTDTGEHLFSIAGVAKMDKEGQSAAYVKFVKGNDNGPSVNNNLKELLDAEKKSKRVEE